MRLIYRENNMSLLTEWEGRTGKYLARGQGVRTERSEVRTSWPRARYFTVRPDLTQSISILSYDHLLLKIWKFCLNLNRTRLHKIRRPRSEQSHTSFYNKNLSFISSCRTRNSKKMTHFLIIVFQLQFMLKSQQKVDIKLSKMCQRHQKLSEWQKVASRFTEIVVKTHENVGVVSGYLSGYLSTSWILLNKGQPATEF